MEVADPNVSALARRMSAQQALALPSPAAPNTVVINARCSLRIEAGHRVIVVAGLPVHHYRAEDAVAELTTAERWIIDGNYLPTVAIRARKADLIVPWQSHRPPLSGQARRS